MAFIDADEFFVIKDGTPSLPALLREYEGFGGLAVNWQVGPASALISRMLPCCRRVGLRARMASLWKFYALRVQASCQTSAV